MLGTALQLTSYTLLNPPQLNKQFASVSLFPSSLDPKPAGPRGRLHSHPPERSAAMKASTCATAKTSGLQRNRQVACFYPAQKRRDEACLSGDMIAGLASSWSAGTSVKSRTSTWVNFVWGWREDAKSWEHISQVDDSVDRMLGMFLTGGLGVEKMSETKQKRVGD